MYSADCNLVIRFPFGLMPGQHVSEARHLNPNSFLVCCLFVSEGWVERSPGEARGEVGAEDGEAGGRVVVGWVGGVKEEAEEEDGEAGGRVVVGWVGEEEEKGEDGQEDHGEEGGRGEVEVSEEEKLLGLPSAARAVSSISKIYIFLSMIWDLLVLFSRISRYFSFNIYMYYWLICFSLQVSIKPR